MRSSKSIFSPRLTTVLSFGLIFNLLTPVSAQANQSFVACVKSSGEVRIIVAGKKCLKSEKQTRVTLTKAAKSSFTGPKGDTGLQGPIGETGPAGAKGDTGSTGPKGDTGATGPAGVNGVTGVKGSSVLTGVGVPANSLGENGDTYIDKNSAMIYGPKANGIWGYGISFAGPAGGQGPAGPAGANGLGLMNDLPTNFQQLYAIDENGSGCCDLPNSKLKILVQFRNISGYTISGLSDSNTVEYSTQLWLQFYDANGQTLYANQSLAFAPGAFGATETQSWNGGANWLANQEKEWLIDIDDIYTSKPTQAKYVAIYFRFLNLRILNPSSSPYPLVGNGQRIDSKDLMITRFSAWPFSD